MTNAPPQTLAEWLADKPFTLCMSAGFFGFFAHCGMLSALEEAGLAPARVVGASAGGLVAGCWGSGMPASDLRSELLDLKRSDFWDPWPGLGLLRGSKFRRHLQRILPVDRFEDARVPIGLAVFDVVSRRTRVVDSGPLAVGIHATCALPGLFQPVWINGRPVSDGGIADRPALTPLRPGERVFFHHLASKSPWRTPGSAALEVPRRDNLVALVIEGLARSGPFRLHLGHTALEQATRATRAALAMPVVDGVVACQAGGTAS